MRACWTGLAALAAAAYLLAGEPSLTPADRVSFQGVGAVRVNMSLDELRRAVGGDLILDEDSVTQDESIPKDTCVFATLTAYRWGISWMLIDGSVARTDVTKRGFATRRGVRPGDTEESVLQKYRGRVKVEPHTYIEGHYLSVESSDRKSAVVFETDGKHVTSYRIGRTPEAFYIEGCQ